jgi:hypothetical protein
MYRNDVGNAFVWLLGAVMGIGGFALIFIAVTKGHWLLLIPAAPLWILAWVIRDNMHDDSL